MDISFVKAALDVWVLPGCRTLREIRVHSCQDREALPAQPGKKLRGEGKAPSFSTLQQLDLAAPLQKQES